MRAHQLIVIYDTPIGRVEARATRTVRGKHGYVVTVRTLMRGRRLQYQYAGSFGTGMLNGAVERAVRELGGE
jgi:hypothetical protein